MTAQATARRPEPWSAGRQYQRLRTAHPVTVLRWLRNGVLLCVAAAAAVSLGIALQASSDISTARSTRQASAEITQARAAASKALSELDHTLRHEDPTLTGTGSAYINQLSQVFTHLTLVAEDNTAGTVETGQIPYIDNLLNTYLQESNSAVLDYTSGQRLGNAGEQYAREAERSLDVALADLQGAEQSGLAAQRGTWSLDAGLAGFWWALAAPFFIMLLLAVATARVLARHFRRLVSGWLLGAVGITALAAALLGYLNARDAASLSANPWAGHPATLTCAMLLFTAAAAFAYAGYQPRLAEYRFRSA